MSTTSSSDQRRCSLCAQPIPTGLRPYQKIEGWERRPVAASRRGGSDIVARRRLDEWACDACVWMLREGYTLGRQDRLFDPS